MGIPDWLLRQIETTTGVEYVLGYGKIAKPGRCVCGGRVMRGQDDEYESAVVDLYTVSRLGEAWAALDGRAAWRLAGGMPGTLELWRRHAWNLHHWPIGGSDTAGPVRVVIAHRCYRPAPEAYRE